MICIGYKVTVSDIFSIKAQCIAKLYFTVDSDKFSRRFCTFFLSKCKESAECHVLTEHRVSLYEPHFFICIDIERVIYFQITFVESLRGM